MADKTYSVYLLDWTGAGGKQYVGLSADVAARVASHSKAGGLGFAHGEPELTVLHTGLDVYAAADAERREIRERGTLAPDGYNRSAGGEYHGARQDAMFNPDHLLRLSRAALAVLAMVDETEPHETPESLAAAGVQKVMARYRVAVSVVVDMRGQGMPPARIAARTGLGHGVVYGMLRDAASVL